MKLFLCSIALLFSLILTGLTGLYTDELLAFSLDGNGHYAVKGQTLTNPGMSAQLGTHQAIEQSFLMEGEARLNDHSSFFLDLRLFDDNNRYMGDQASPTTCAVRGSDSGTTDSNCDGRVQDQDQPGYAPITPKITAAYARYALDFCLLEMGRRQRNWGLGALLNSGRDPFSTSANYFDGVSCQLNTQKSQAIGFSIGYDKLQETGAAYDNPYDRPNSDAVEKSDFLNSRRSDPSNFGSTRSSDDMDQIFFTIEYDDRDANSGGSYTKNIGVYFANMFSPESKNDGVPASDIKYLDLFSGFYLGNFALRNELIFRMGHSAAPVWLELGGNRLTEDKSVARNSLTSIALVGNFEWTMSQSGSFIGPEAFRQGTASRHSLKLDYAYAPGDKDSYYTDIDGTGSNLEVLRDSKVSAFPLNSNYKPALILFRNFPTLSTYNHNRGAFNTDRVVNTFLLAFGYKYESIQYGDYSVKLIQANLLEGVPGEVRTFYDANPGLQRPVGYGGKSLGYELDLEYNYKLSRELEIGTAAAMALAGNAWDVRSDHSPSNSFLLQTQIALHF